MKRANLENFIEELSALIRARYSLVHLQTFEESRCLDVLSELSKKRKSNLYVWSRTEGVLKEGKPISDIKDPIGVLKWIEELNQKAVLVLKDYHPYLKEPTVVRKLRDLGQAFKRTQKNIIFLSAEFPIPSEMNKEVAILEVPMPSRGEIENLVRKAASILPQSSSEADGHANLSSNQVDALSNAASGLTYDEIENVLAKSIVSKGKLEPMTIQEEKRQIVKKGGILEFIDLGGGSVSEIGGLSNLKSWLKMRKRGMSKEAEVLNLPKPKGILLVGIPGCGKSLTAMTVGREWELPLLRLDLGRVFSGLVGSSETNIRNALATCEAVSPSVLWIDEIEKGLSGTQSSGQSDGGTTSRVFGTVLTWMQEKTSPVFVVATANDISSLPPEFLRKGRFDEIFFVDLPTPKEREEILDIHLKRYGWIIKDLNVSETVKISDGFSGAEIEQSIVEGRYLAFGEEEEFSQRHLSQALEETVPLSKTMGDKIENLRSWATNRARPASAVARISQKGDRFEMRSNSLEFKERLNQ